MKQIAAMNEELTVEERNLLSGLQERDRVAPSVVAHHFVH